MSNTVPFLKQRAETAEVAKEKAQRRFASERLAKEDVVAEKRRIEDTLQEYLKRFREAQDKIYQLKEKVIQLEKIQTLSDKNHEGCVNENIQLEAEIIKETAANREQKEQLVILTDEKRELREHLRLANQELEEMRRDVPNNPPADTIKRLRQEKKDSTKIIRELRECHEAIKETRDNLIVRIEDATEAQELAEAQIIPLRAENNELRNENDRNNHQLNQLNALVQEQRDQIYEVLNENDEKTQTIATARNRKRALKEKCRKLKARKKKLRKQRDDAKNQLREEWEKDDVTVD